MAIQDAIFLVGLIFMAVALMIAGYIFKRPALVLGASGAWLITALVSYNISAAAWDVYYGMFWFCIALVLVSGFEAFMVREKPAPPEPPKSEWDSYADDMETRREQSERLRNLRRTGNKPRTSKYAKTGKPD